MEEYPFIPVPSLKTDVLPSPVWRVCNRTCRNLQVSLIVAKHAHERLKRAIVRWRFTASVPFNLHDRAIQFFRNRRGIESAAESEGCFAVPWGSRVALLKHIAGLIPSSAENVALFTGAVLCPLFYV